MALTRAEINRRYRERHPDRAALSEKRWRKQHPENGTANHKRYRERHPKRVATQRERWKKVHPERMAASRHLRRARKLGNGGSFTAAEWITLKLFYGNKCLACGKTERQLKRLGRTLTPDHVLPLAKKGRNDIRNIQPLCHTRKRGISGGCNNHKYTNHIDYR
jgi:hypothetical protein